MAAFNFDGKVISVGDRATILGVISSVSTSDNTANVVIQPPLSTSTFTVKAPDVYSPVTQTSEGAGASGVKLVAGADCTVPGLVTAITGSGNTATLTVQTFSSGTSVSVPSGAVRSDNV